MEIDLNCDIGESFGVYKLGLDEEVIKYVTSVNIACGFHAGDPLVMKNTVALAKKYDVKIGAHPGFYDLAGFGRREMVIELDRLKQEIFYQVGALQAIAKSQGMEINHIKPHGALYNMAANDQALAQVITEVVLELDKSMVLFAPFGSQMVDIARKMGVKVWQEAFADREYNSDGSLVSRKIKGAVLTDPTSIVERVIKLVKYSKVTTIDETELDIQPDTICVHGDNIAAVEIAKTLKHRLLTL